MTPKTLSTALPSMPKGVLFDEFDKAIRADWFAQTSESKALVEALRNEVRRRRALGSMDSLHELIEGDAAQDD